MDLGALLEGFGYIGSGLQMLVDLVQVSLDGAGWIASAFSWVSENLQGIIDLLGSIAGSTVRQYRAFTVRYCRNSFKIQQFRLNIN